MLLCFGFLMFLLRFMYRYYKYIFFFSQTFDSYDYENAPVSLIQLLSFLYYSLKMNKLGRNVTGKYDQSILSSQLSFLSYFYSDCTPRRVLIIYKTNLYRL